MLPVVVGLNVTVAVQVAPAARLVPHVLVWLNSLASPVRLKGLSVNAVVPAL